VQVRASVIVPTRNRADRLDACLAALARQTLPAEQFEILVVDNGSTDGTPERIARWADRRPGLRGVEEPEAGVSRARNAGIAAARGELLAFVDDDAVAEPRWLATLLGAYDRWPRVGAACGRARLRLERRPPAWYGSFSETWYSAMDFGPAARLLLDPAEVPWSLNLSARAALAREVGGFPEQLGRVDGNLLSGEEFPFITAIRSAGMRIAYEPDAVVWHAVPADRLRLRWILRRAWVEGRSMPVRNEAEGVEPMNALHATVHVTCRDWISFGRRLRGPASTREVLAAELTRRSFGAGRAWSAITDGGP
jgi:glycosyltransferase involved in cell wall biosynthesis